MDKAVRWFDNHAHRGPGPVLTAVIATLSLLTVAQWDATYAVNNQIVPVVSVVQDVTPGPETISVIIGEVKE